MLCFFCFVLSVVSGVLYKLFLTYLNKKFFWNVAKQAFYQKDLKLKYISDKFPNIKGRSHKNVWVWYNLLFVSFTWYTSYLDVQ